MELLISYSSAHPVLFFILGFFALIFFYGVFFTIFSIPRMIMRFLIIQKHGYPPEHCNVDGKNIEDDPEN